MTRLFDSVAVVDWSARSRPSPERETADAIWLGLDRRGRETPPAYLRTRAAALEAVADLAARERAAGRRLLIGFDFPFGYPAGVAEAITGRAEALALWDWLAGRIADAPDNANNRYEVASEMNAALGPSGPFWGRPAAWTHLALPPIKAGIAYAPEGRWPERRIVERRVRRAKPAWQLAYTGSVGSQALLGIAALWRLRRDPRMADARIWPFETGLAAPDAPVVIAEIYPSLFADAVRDAQGPGEILDRAQVRVSAARLAALDAAGRLAPLFAAGADLGGEDRAAVAREEAWILGVGA